MKHFFVVLFLPETIPFTILKFLSGYIKNFEVFDPHRVGKITVELQGRIKDCKALTYRQDLRATEIEKYRTRMLPTRQVFYQLRFDICEHSYAPLVVRYIYRVLSILIVDTVTAIERKRKVKIWRVIVC
jgi:ribosomal protein S8